MEVRFYNLGEIDDALLKYAVIASRYQGKWIYCKHKDRDTWEVPGGRREVDRARGASEPIITTAKRELFEETGAATFDLTALCIYSVRQDVPDDARSETQKIPAESFGILCFAEIYALSPLPDSEIELIEFFEEMPANLTYPEIQPHLMDKILRTPNLFTPE
jgi:ADP-ribose pyrophosphatase